MAANKDQYKHNDSGFIDDAPDKTSFEPEEEPSPLSPPVSEEGPSPLSPPVSEEGPSPLSPPVSEEGPSPLSLPVSEEGRASPCALSICEEGPSALLTSANTNYDESKHAEREMSLSDRCKVEMLLQELRHKREMSEKQELLEEKEMEIIKLRACLRESSRCQEYTAAFRDGGGSIEPSGPLIADSSTPHIIQAIYEVCREAEGQIAQESEQNYQFQESELRCSPVEDISYSSIKESKVTGMKLPPNPPSYSTVNEKEVSPDLGGKVIIALPGIPPSFGSFWYPAHEAVLLDETSVIAPGSKYIFYNPTNVNTITAAIHQMTNMRRDCSFHCSIIICVLFGFPFSKKLTDAVDMAAQNGIISVCAAWSRNGIMSFPAALGSTFCIGAVDHMGNLLPCSARGGAVDYVEVAVASHQELHGPSISAVRFAAQLAKLCQGFFRANIPIGIWNNVMHLKELLLFATSKEYTSGMGYGKVDFKSLMERPAEQIKKDLKHMTSTRNRRQLPPDPAPLDARINTAVWSSPSHPWRLSHKDKITVAMIDCISVDYLIHINNVHKNTPVLQNEFIQYFYISPKDLMQECCKHFHREKDYGHILQCGTIVATISPDCKLLMIRHDRTDPEIEKLLTVVEKEKPHILLLSGVTTDTADVFSHALAPILCSCIVLCAAGNDGKTDRDTICYPARVGNVIAVGACDRYGNRSAYSSVGRELTIMCPGQFDAADETGRGATCYATAAAGAFIAQLLYKIDIICGNDIIFTPDGEKKISSLVQNTYLMRHLLCSPRLGLCSRAEHSPIEGYGMLLIDKLSLLMPEMIKSEIIAFYG